MNKIMKKVLAIVLALAVLCVPMMASAAEGDAVAVPSYEYCINSGDTVTVPAGEKIFFEISTQNLYDVLPFTVIGTGAFDVAVCTEDGEGAYIEGATASANDGTVSTTIQGFESTYGYACFAITNNSGADADYTCTIEFPVGSEANPYEIAYAYVYATSEVTVPANTKYYINATLPEMNQEYQLTITGATGYMAQFGWNMPVSDTDGTIVASVSQNPGWGCSFSIENTTDTEQTYSLYIEDMPVGTSANPEALYLGETTIDLDGAEYYYSYEATKNGTFKLVMDNELCENGWTYLITHGYDTYHFSTGWGEESKNVRYINVAAGDVLSIGVSVPSYDAEDDSYSVYDPGTGSIHFTTYFGTYGDVDCDKSHTAIDLVMLRRAILDSEFNADVPGAYEVNADGEFNILDLIRLKKLIAGIITVGDPVAVPSYEYCIVSGETVTVPAGETVYFEISTENLTDEFPFIVSGEGDFDVIICVEDGSGAYKVDNFNTAANGTVNTTIQGYDSTFGYACFAITNNSEADADYTCTISFPVGIEANPYEIAFSDIGLETTVTVPANTQYYIDLSLPAQNTDYQLTISGATGYAAQFGWNMPVDDVDGIVVATVNEAPGWGCTFNIQNSTDEAQTYTLLLEKTPVGTRGNPAELSTNKTAILELEDSEYFLAWTADYAGTFTLTMDNENCADGWTYNLIHNDMTYNFSTGWNEAESNVCSVEVAAGEVVLIGFSIPSYDAENDYYNIYSPMAGVVQFSTTFTTEFTEGQSIAVPDYEYCINSGDTITVPAGATTIFEISTQNIYDVLPFTISGTGAFDLMMCTESGTGAYLAGPTTAITDGTYSGTVQGFESTFGYACFAITNNSDDAVDYTCTISFPVGTEANPYEISYISTSTSNTVTVPANTQYYISASLPIANVDYQLTISGATGYAAQFGWNMPVDDVDGIVVATVNEAPVWGCTFNIQNNTDTEQVYVLTVDNMPLGAKSNPDELAVNTTVTKVLDAEEYYYVWTAETAGTFTLTMDNTACKDGWTYNLIHNDMTYNFSTGWDEAESNVCTVEVAVGEEILLGVSIPSYDAANDYYNVYEPASGTVVFSTAFVAAE